MGQGRIITGEAAIVLPVDRIPMAIVERPMPGPMLSQGGSP